MSAYSDSDRDKTKKTLSNKTTVILFKRYMEDKLLQASKTPATCRMVHSRALCAVCGAPAIGRNFDAMTCLSCKAFFRRNAYNDHLTFTCRLSSSCEINSSTRRHCSACRLRKCFQQGMKKELIRSLSAITQASSAAMNNLSQRQILRPTTDVHSANGNQRYALSPDDWNFLTNIRNAYEEYCVQKFYESHQVTPLTPPIQPYRSRIKLQRLVDLKHKYILITASFLKRIHQLNICSYSSDDQFSYIQKNFSCVLSINVCELMQTKVLECLPWEHDRLALETILPEEIIENLAKIIKAFQKLLPYDPLIMKLCLIILSLSSQTAPLKKKSEYMLLDFHAPPENLLHSQNFYMTLLWKYVICRFSYQDAVQFTVRFIQNFLQRQRLESEIESIVDNRDDLSQFVQQMQWKF